MANGNVVNPRHLYALSVCGFSGSGKTTLLEAAIPRLLDRGLAVAVIKHDAHGLHVDPRGKDSDRLFRAGADVILHAPGEELRRTHVDDGLAFAVRTAAQDHDLVLVEGHKGSPLPKVWLADRKGSEPPRGTSSVLAVLPRNGVKARTTAFLEIADRWLTRNWLRTPVMTAVLTARRSVVLHGPVRRTLAPAPDCGWPLSGVLAAMRWAPQTAWIVSTERPRTSEVEELLSRRAPGTWAILTEKDGPAYYDFRARGLLEALAQRGERRSDMIAPDTRVRSRSGRVPGTP